MSHFYGTLQGSRGQATRCGTKDSGITATAASWQGAVMTHLWTDAMGVNRFRVVQTKWHGHGMDEILAEGVVGQPSEPLR